MREDKIMTQCCDCRDGEHENYDEKLELCYVKNPETGKMVKRGWLCQEHREMYRSDGYIVERC